MSKNLEPVIYAAVRRLYDERIEKKSFPYIAVERDIKAAVSELVGETLTDMVADGILQMSSNVNGIRMFAPINVEMTTNDDI